MFHTPGHTQGSVSYYGEGMLFSGDTLFRESIGRYDLPGGDGNQEMNSIIDKLLPLPDDTIVLPGHMLRNDHRLRAREQSLYSPRSPPPRPALSFSARHPSSSSEGAGARSSPSAHFVGGRLGSP